MSPNLIDNGPELMAKRAEQRDHLIGSLALGFTILAFIACGLSIKLANVTAEKETWMRKHDSVVVQLKEAEIIKLEVK